MNVFESARSKYKSNSIQFKLLELQLNTKNLMSTL